jgi:hypothetical protein
MAILIVSALPNAAFAQYNYTLKVPYNITNAPAGGTAGVRCILGQGAKGNGTVVDLRSPVAVVPASGQLSGTFTVPASIPWALGTYICSLQITSPGQPNLINLTGPDPAFNPAAQTGWTGTMWLQKNCPC